MNLLFLRGFGNNQVLLSTRSNVVLERESDVAIFNWIEEGKYMIKVKRVFLNRRVDLWVKRNGNKRKLYQRLDLDH